ncbi:MAG TPA: 6-carboxytetrahydropterin synthase [Pirellulaceae bacterium]|nr:6-carboxytetrahydropterin synthase [Pirellulaceae bacterium]HMP69203.1 6-carboxytetrahydropterin synthase [Pirellulaceae bacterium]
MKQIDFCAGHRLLNHGGKCENLHGHNYRLQVHVSAKELDSVGRVIDFVEIRNLFKAWIDEHWDHGFVLAEFDSNAIEAVKQVQPHKLYLIPWNPTAELMARYLMERVVPQLGLDEQRDVRVPKLVLWETETSFAEVQCS